MINRESLTSCNGLELGDYLQVLKNQPQASRLRRGDVVRVVYLVGGGFGTDGGGLLCEELTHTRWMFDYELIGKYFKRLEGLRLPDEDSLPS